MGEINDRGVGGIKKILLKFIFLFFLIIIENLLLSKMCQLAAKEI